MTSKRGKKIQVDKLVKKEINLEYVYKDYYKISNRECKNNINMYVNLAFECVRDEINNKKYREINFNMQNNNMIIRRIKILNVNNKKDIESMISFELTQYIPIDIHDYIIKYTILETTIKELDIQVILVPKYMIYICNEISSMLNMKPRELNVNFDILQKLISLDKVKDFNEKALFVEYKGNEIIVNKVENKRVIETYILQNTHQSYQSIVKLIEEYNQAFYYGSLENNIINNANDNNNFKSMELKEDKKLQITKCSDEYEKIEYINSIGMII